MDIEQLKQQIKVVAKARIESTTAIDARAIARTQWETEHKDLEVAVSETYKVKEAEENKLRELTLQAYAETGDKAPAPGVAIREITKLEYDPKDALKWAMSHQIALSLDKKSFEGFAKATPLDFVTVTSEPQATIATKLEID